VRRGEKLIVSVIYIFPAPTHLIHVNTYLHERVPQRPRVPRDRHEREDPGHGRGAAQDPWGGGVVRQERGQGPLRLVLLRRAPPLQTREQPVNEGAVARACEELWRG
jgi:hypothetical protein